MAGHTAGHMAGHKVGPMVRGLEWPMDLAHVLAHGLAHCLSPYLKGGAPMQFVPSCTLSVPKVGPPGVDVVSDTLCLASYNFDSHIWRGR